MMQRFFEWYGNLRPIEKFIVPNSSKRVRNNVRATIVMLAALPGIATIESYHIKQPWRDFGSVDLNRPAPAIPLEVGQPWPDAVPVKLLSELLPQDTAAVLPTDAAVPLDQDRLTVFSVLEKVQSLNTPVSQSWLSSLTNPEGEPVTTEVALWCGFNLEKSPAERMCIATLPVPVFGRVLSGTCLSRDGFALYHTLLGSDICEQDEHKGVCRNMAEWNTDPPSSGEMVEIDGVLQCSASMILPYLTLTMTREGVRVDTETVSPFVDTFETDIEHGQGFTRSLTVLTHDAVSNRDVSWADLVDASGAIPISIKAQTRAAGLFWTEYRSRHDVKRGHNAKEPTRQRSLFLGELNIPLNPPASLAAAARFLDHDLAILSEVNAPIQNAKTLNLPEACQLERTTAAELTNKTNVRETTGHMVRLSQIACPEEALQSILVQSLTTK